MGYIMPITQFEYIQYTNRMVTTKKEAVKSVGGISPILPLSLFQQLDQEEEKQIENIIPTKYSSSYKIQVPQYVVEQITADLTGKGGLFNQRI